MGAGRWRRELVRIAAPAALLAVVTAVVLVVRTDLRGTPSKEQNRAPQTQPRRADRNARATYYSVRTGDTLGSVAARFRTTVRRLERLNPGADPGSLQIGQRLRVR